jgi:hypothetical protein
MTRVVCGALMCAVLSVSPAFAQTTPATAGAEKGFVNLSGGGQLSTLTISSSTTAPVYNQTANASAVREVSGGPLFDITAGMRVRGKLSVAATASFRTATSDAALSASVPHPLFFDTPRSVSTTIAGMKHQETWFGVLAAYPLSSTDRRTIMLLAGPMVASVKHDTITGLSVAEGTSVTAPTVTATRGTISKSFWGYSVGVDVRVMFSSAVGVGGFIRYTAAPGNVTGTESVTLGGVQAGGGLRFRF